MPRRARPRPPEGRHTGSGDRPPSLLELERFSTTSLKQWREAAQHLGRLQTAVYFGLETLRQSHGAALIEALRAAAQVRLPLDGWCRIVDYRYGLDPLSSAGSLTGIGGRFNIGSGLEPATFTPFPALYIAEHYEAAFQEKFGAASTSNATAGLTALDLALRRPGSFTQVRLSGFLESVLDVGDPHALKGFVEVIRAFAMPKLVNELARRLSLREPPTMIRTAATLKRRLLEPQWRVLPMQFDLPSNSQVFGRIACAAGVHGILYPSTRSEQGRCLALFPQNWQGSGSWIELADRAPPGTKTRRLDGETQGTR